MRIVIGVVPMLKVWIVVALVLGGELLIVGSPDPVPPNNILGAHKRVLPAHSILLLCVPYLSALRRIFASMYRRFLSWRSWRLDLLCRLSKGRFIPPTF